MMRHLTSIVAPALAAVALLSSGAALAHAKLVVATPAADASASNVRTVTLTFSESPVEKLSGVEIVMTAMPGMAKHAPMPVKGIKTALGSDGKTLVVNLPRTLPAGSYGLTWHVVTGDTHRSEGGYAFSVK
ncbi:copper resistance protein CopC [Rhizorhabdus wittichii DC-6]|nr:copper resistance protein CopC [Rhizorhabdus wittichii DC-6]